MHSPPTYITHKETPSTHRGKWTPPFVFFNSLLVFFLIFFRCMRLCVSQGNNILEILHLPFVLLVLSLIIFFLYEVCWDYSLLIVRIKKVVIIKKIDEKKKVLPSTSS